MGRVRGRAFYRARTRAGGDARPRAMACLRDRAKRAYASVPVSRSSLTSLCEVRARP
ncbi:hypothetical protein T492DRAFT_968255 [Pavlovales sp. CCMP2436]|nr:hypothetical protein T492DRAFT_968255 [Pavlovales sp. CCMP2436]